MRTPSAAAKARLKTGVPVRDLEVTRRNLIRRAFWVTVQEFELSHEEAVGLLGDALTGDFEPVAWVQEEIEVRFCATNCGTEISAASRSGLCSRCQGRVKTRRCPDCGCLIGTDSTTCLACHYKRQREERQKERNSNCI